MARSRRIVFGGDEGGDARHVSVLIVAIALYTPKKVRLLFFEGAGLSICGFTARLQTCGEFPPHATCQQNTTLN